MFPPEVTVEKIVELLIKWSKILRQAPAHDWVHSSLLGLVMDF